MLEESSLKRTGPQASDGFACRMRKWMQLAHLQMRQSCAVMSSCRANHFSKRQHATKTTASPPEDAPVALRHVFPLLLAPVAVHPHVNALVLVCSRR